MKPFAEVPVKWSKYSGANGDEVRYLLDGATGPRGVARGERQREPERLGDAAGLEGR